MPEILSLLSLKAIHATQFLGQSLVQGSLCTVIGDSDIYGLGVRLGLYLTNLALLLAYCFAPSAVDSIRSALHTFTFAFHSVLIKNVLDNRPAMLEMYIALWMTALNSVVCVRCLWAHILSLRSCLGNILLRNNGMDCPRPSIDGGRGKR
jgi:hypothetical protein